MERVDRRKVIEQFRDATRIVMSVPQEDRRGMDFEVDGIFMNHMYKRRARFSGLISHVRQKVGGALQHVKVDDVEGIEAELSDAEVILGWFNAESTQIPQLLMTVLGDETTDDLHVIANVDFIDYEPDIVLLED
ncbi:MAG: hypothetical protein R3313_01085 [Candidatus Saccharimonadales bacterium]|nr:hypothetical protein [Candidatus Saccharimonadales bacterium]